MHYYYLTIADGSGKSESIHYHEILYAFEVNNVTILVTERKTFLLLHSLEQVRRKLPPYQFKRVNDNHLVAVNKVFHVDLDNNYVLIRPQVTEYDGTMPYIILGLKQEYASGWGKKCVLMGIELSRGRSLSWLMLETLLNGWN